jgi:hypothetical protein
MDKRKSWMSKSPNPMKRAILGRIPPFLVALGFWIAGSYVLAFSRARQQAVLFFFLCQIAVVTLTSGAISAYGPEWTKIGLLCGLLWLGVAAVQLHLVFPKRIHLLKKRQISSVLFLVTALIQLYLPDGKNLRHSPFASLVLCGLRRLQFSPSIPSRLFGAGAILSKNLPT